MINRSSAENRRDTWGLVAKLLVWTFLVAVFSVTVYRLLHGIDFVDEALYVVMPYRFALGAHPYVDETLFHQTASLILYPFFKGFLLATGGTTGIMLYMRFLYLVFMSSVGWVVWRATKRSLGNLPAILLALMCPAFIYFNLPGLSYNTLGLGFLTAGSLLGIIALSERKNGYFVAAGLAHGLAVMAYPILVVAVAIYACIFIYSANNRALVVRYLAGGGAVFALYVSIILAAGPANYWASYKMTSGLGVFGGKLSKLLFLLKSFFHNYQGKLYILAVIAIAWLMRNRQPWLSAVLMTAIPVAALSFTGYPNQVQSIGYITYLCFAAPACYMFTVKQRESSLIFWLVWFPGFAAGLLSAYTSTTGYWAATVGFFQASVATVILLWMAIQNILAGTPRLRLTLGTAVITAPVVILLVCQFNIPYNDSAMSSLTSRVPSGPYYGLYTTPEKEALVITLANDVKTVGEKARSILFFDNLPGGYLLTGLTPFTDRAWSQSYVSVVVQSYMVRNVTRIDTIRYYEERGRYPDVIVKMHLAYYGGPDAKVKYEKTDPLSLLAASGTYRIAVNKTAYTIYVKRRL